MRGLLNVVTKKHQDQGYTHSYLSPFFKNLAFALPVNQEFKIESEGDEPFEYICIYPERYQHMGLIYDHLRSNKIHFLDYTLGWGARDFFEKVDIKEAFTERQKGLYKGGYY